MEYSVRNDVLQMKRVMDQFTKMAQAHSFRDRAMLDWKTRQWDQAITNMQDAISLNPQDETWQFHLGRIYHSMHEYAKAAEQYRKAMFVHKGYEYTQPHFWLAQVLALSGDRTRAIKEYREAIELNNGEEVSLALEEMGFLLMDAGELDQAIEAFRESLSVRPTIEAGFGLGIAYFKTGHYAEALYHLNDSLPKWPGIKEAPDIHLWLARTLESLQRYDEACDEYHRAIRRKPGNAELHRLLGNLLLQIGNAKAAKRQLRVAMTIEKNLPT